MADDNVIKGMRQSLLQINSWTIQTACLLNISITGSGNVYQEKGILNKQPSEFLSGTTLSILVPQGSIYDNSIKSLSKCSELSTPISDKRICKSVQS